MADKIAELLAQLDTRTKDTVEKLTKSAGSAVADLSAVAGLDLTPLTAALTAATEALRAEHDARVEDADTLRNIVGKALDRIEVIEKSQNGSRRQSAHTETAQAASGGERITKGVTADEGLKSLETLIGGLAKNGADVSLG